MKPRKNVRLWQTYQLWHELMELRKKSKLRINAVERGVSNYDVIHEKLLLKAVNFDVLVAPKNKLEKEGSIWQTMVNYGIAVGPIWDWCLSHKGIGEGLAAQLLAQIDDISNFDSPAKLWRHCGYGLYHYWVDEKGTIQAPYKGWKHYAKTKKLLGEFSASGLEENQHYFIDEFTGNTLKALTVVDRLEPEEIAHWVLPSDKWKLVQHRDVNVASYHSSYNKSLKSTCYNIADQFIRQQTPYYVDIYYAEKTRQREKHPEKVTVNGRAKYTNAHIHNMAWRKMVKEFLKELWFQWRISEGLPADNPSVHVWEIPSEIVSS